MTIFSKIAAGEIPSYKVASDKHFYAFLDINPMAKGHTLVIPRKENDYIFNIDNGEYTALFLFAKRVAAALKKAVPCSRVGMMVIGLEVPHTHIHLIPIEKEGDMSLAKPKLKLSDEEMRTIANKIHEEFK